MLPLPALSPLLQRHLRWLAPCLFLAALAAAALQAPRDTATGLVVPPARPAPAAPPLYQARMLPGTGSAAASPSLARLADGTLVAAWVGRAGGKYAQDAIWFSRLVDDQWLEPLPLTTLEDSAGTVFAHLDRLAQPVLAAAGERLQLWYSASGTGGLGGFLLYSESDDGGHHWRRPTLRRTTPLASRAPLAQTPLPLADGGFGLPLSQSGLNRHATWLRVDRAGRIVDQRRLPAGGAYPAIAATETSSAIALLATFPGLTGARSGDGGQTWQTAPAPAIANPGTPLALLRLASGRLLLAGNEGSGRGRLTLWLGDAQGNNWQLARRVEDAADATADFSEPALLQAADGRIHLIYAWRRQGIRHLSFNEPWLTGGQP
ncbi:exo-alpha-sialidase [Azonexus sp.]|uniref:exo-alpha-sialidase n=1 Tax=Azonexus sp. TaxID=1872668 RepID=UPI0035AF475C